MLRRRQALNVPYHIRMIRMCLTSNMFLTFTCCPVPGGKDDKHDMFTVKFRLMSSGQTPCSRCAGKFGLETSCGVCGNLSRLQDYLQSERCPADLSAFAARSIREVHLACLEEADRLLSVKPPEITSHPSTVPKSAPPLASGGLAVRDPRGRSVGGRTSPDPATNKEDEFEEVKEELPASPERRGRRTSRSRRRRRTHSGDRVRRSHLHRSHHRHREEEPRPEPVERPVVSGRERKHRPTPSPVSGGEEEEEEEEEESPVEAAGSGRSRERAAPRPPSNSPLARRERAPASPERPPRGRDQRWRGPIPAWDSRRDPTHKPKKAPKKNKGRKKKERPREYRGKGYWGQRR